MFHERSIHELKAFQRKIHLLNVWGLEKLEDFPKHMPNRIMSTTLPKGSRLHPSQTIQKMHCILQKDWKRNQIFYKFQVSEIGICVETASEFITLKATSKRVVQYFLHCHFKTPCIIIIVQNFYTSACFLSRDTTFYIEPCQLLVQKQFKSLPVGYLSPGLRG